MSEYLTLKVLITTATGDILSSCLYFSSLSSIVYGLYDLYIFVWIQCFWHPSNKASLLLAKSNIVGFSVCFFVL